MWQYGADTALTSDRHFVQAGFRTLLSSGPIGVAEAVVPGFTGDPVPAPERMAAWVRDAA
jgi:hypothetical protein